MNKKKYSQTKFLDLISKKQVKEKEHDESITSALDLILGVLKEVTIDQNMLDNISYPTIIQAIKILEDYDYDDASQNKDEGTGALLEITFISALKDTLDSFIPERTATSKDFF